MPTLRKKGADRVPEQSHTYSDLGIFDTWQRAVNQVRQLFQSRMIAFLTICTKQELLAGQTRAEPLPSSLTLDELLEAYVHVYGEYEAYHLFHHEMSAQVSDVDQTPTMGATVVCLLGNEQLDEFPGFIPVDG